MDGTGHKFAKCGTAACIGGWAKVLSGYRGYSDGSDGPRFEELLGLTISEGERLFYRSYWPDKFKLTYKDNGSRASAKVAAARIDHFIKTKGRE